MDDLVGLAASGVSGGVVGVVGNFLNRVFGVWESKVKFEQQFKLMTLQAEADARKEAHEVELIGLEMQAHAAETEHAIELTDVAGGWDAFNTSVRNETEAESTSGVAAFIRTTMRPFLTYGMWLGGLGLVITGAADQQTSAQFINAVVFTGTSATLWWFGERNAVRSQLK